MRCFYVLKKWSSAKLSLNWDLSLNKVSLNWDGTVLLWIVAVFFESGVKKEEIKNCAFLLNSSLKKLKKNASLERISTNCAQKRWEQLSYRTLLLENEVKYDPFLLKSFYPNKNLYSLLAFGNKDSGSASVWERGFFHHDLAGIDNTTMGH